MPRTKGSTNKPKAKVLNFSTLKNIHDKTYTKRKLTVVVDNKNWEIYIDEKFAPSKIQALTQEIVNSKFEMEDNKINLDAGKFAQMLALKYFSSILIPDTLEERIAMMELLVDTEVDEDTSLFEKITNSFDEEEYNKILKYMVKVAKQYKEINDNPEMLKEMLGLEFAKNYLRQDILDLDLGSENSDDIEVNTEINTEVNTEE